jgi:hypothetical protein
MSRYITHLIEDCRDSSENADFTSTTGIQDREFVRYLTEGQKRLHNLITQQHAHVFEKEKIYSLSQNQETVSLPDDIHAVNMVAKVEYSYNGDADEYSPLDVTSSRNRQTDVEGVPEYFFVRNNKVYLVPTPNHPNAKLRVTYIRRSHQLGKRMAQVSSITLSDNSISSMSVDVSTVGVDATSLERADGYFTVVDSQGNIKCDSVRFDSIDTTTGAITINSGYEKEDSETIAVGDWLIAGRSASSHIDANLTDMAERYIEAFCIYKIFKRDSSVDSQEQLTELQALEQEIVDSYKEIVHDIYRIPQINSDEVWW